MKEIVTLRERQLKDGTRSLYLDYFVNGTRIRENLRMYLVPEVDKITRFQNKETMQTAIAAKAKKIVAIQNEEAGFFTQKKITIGDYLDEQIRYYESQGKYGMSKPIVKIRKWLNCDMMLFAFTKEHAMDTLRRMRSKLADSTVYDNYCTLNTVLNNAARLGYIHQNPLKKIASSETPKRPESTREYLTLDEVRRLSETDCYREDIKHAFLFSCFTGLRLSDIEELTWAKIRLGEAGWRVEARQIKTKKLVYIPLSANAMHWLPERSDGKVWNLPSRAVLCCHLSKWVKASGIKKHITFHCARHTNATLMLTYGADIYTVSKLLGHANVQTTQIYAKIVDAKKQEAVNLIPEI